MFVPCHLGVPVMSWDLLATPRDTAYFKQSFWSPNSYCSVMHACDFLTFHYFRKNLVISGSISSFIVAFFREHQTLQKILSKESIIKILVQSMCLL